MADLLFLSGGFPTQTSTTSASVETDQSGNAVFENEAYYFYANFPSLNLQPITSNVPVLTRTFGWINGG